MTSVASAVPINYTPYPSVSSPGFPRRMVTGDLTGDGLKDLAATSPSFGRIRVHALTPSGEFLGGASVFVGGNPAALFAADFDRDGDLDLAWADEASGDVGVLLQTPGSSPVFEILRQRGPDEPTAVVLADNDGDDWPDLVSAHRGADQLVLYPNLDGELGVAEAEPAGDRPDRLILLEHPGGPTLAMRQSGRLSGDVRLRNLEDGSRGVLPVPGGGEIFAVDMDGDARDELLIIDEILRELVVYRNASGQWTEDTRFAVDGQVTGVAIAQTAPGQRRLAVASRERRRVMVYEDQGSGMQRVSAWYVGGGMGELLYEDINGDAAPDVVVAQADLQRLQVLPPLGSGFFAAEAASTPAGPTAVTRGSGISGEVLFAVPASIAGQVAVYSVQGTLLGEPLLLDAADGVWAARFADLDGNPGSDLVSVSRTGGLRVHLSDGGGGFTPGAGFIPVGEIADLALVDVVGGPALDLLLARLDPPALVVHEGRGDGTFVVVPAAEITTTEPLVVVRGHDLDLDGRLDIVALGFDSLLTIFLNRAGEALAGVDLLVENAPRDVAFGRFNADAFPDMVTINEGASDFSVLTSVLAGVYTVSVRGTPSLPGASRLEVADFNLDGVDDFCVVASGTRSVGIHLNNGTPEEPQSRFTPPVQFELVESPVDLAVLDLDGDGSPDLVGIDSGAAVMVTRLSDPFGAAGSPTAVLEVDEQPTQRTVQVRSTAEYAHDLRLTRLPGNVVLPLEKIGPGFFEALDDADFSLDLVYVVEDRRGTELDRLSLPARVVTGAPSDLRPRLLPTRYESGRAILRMRAPVGVVPEVRIYDLRGRRVMRLDVVGEGEGWFEASWSGTDFRGRPVSRGRYLVRASLGPSWPRCSPTSSCLRVSSCSVSSIHRHRVRNRASLSISCFPPRLRKPTGQTSRTNPVSSVNSPRIVPTARPKIRTS
jgi:hypothetical protein